MHHYNRCKIRRGIQIRGQNRVTMQRKTGKCRKLSENHKIAFRKNDVKKYLGHQQPFERASKNETFGAW